MSQHRILLTGASGYLGGTVLAQLSQLPNNSLPPYSKLYALVRTEEQANAVKKYGAEPLTIDFSTSESIHKVIIDNQITIVYYLIDAWGATNYVAFIQGLAEVKKATGLDTHFLFTTGAKLFSSHTGAPTFHALLDTNGMLNNIQKHQMKKAIPELVRPALSANDTVIETANALGVKSYIFIPCIVYGAGEGFGNKISIQTTAIVKAAKKVRRVYKVDQGRPTWPVSHVLDTASLYIDILRAILESRDIGHGANGYYLASSGSVAWDDIYGAMATALEKRGVVDSAKIEKADEDALNKMGEALGCPANLVPLMVGGLCTLTADHGSKIGWKPKYPARHILEDADAEVELILKSLDG